MDHLPYQIRFIIETLPEFLKGLTITVEIGLMSLVLALVGGLLLVLPRISAARAVRAPVRAYIELLRNTPLLIQMYLLYFGLPLIGLRLSGFTTGMIAIAMQHSAFLAEVYRGAIESIPEGQWQAGRAVGLRYGQIMRKIILPQAFAKVLAPLGNQVVLLVKDTSLVAAIGVADLTLTGKIIIERSAATYEIFITIALIYLVLTTVVGGITRGFERYGAKAR